MPRMPRKRTEPAEAESVTEIERLRGSQKEIDSNMAEAVNIMTSTPGHDVDEMQEQETRQALLTQMSTLLFCCCPAVLVGAGILYLFSQINLPNDMQFGRGVDLLGYVMNTDTVNLRYGLGLSSAVIFASLFVLDVQEWSARNQCFGYIGNFLVLLGCLGPVAVITLCILFQPWISIMLTFMLIPVWHSGWYHLYLAGININKVQHMCGGAPDDLVGRHIRCLQAVKVYAGHDCAEHPGQQVITLQQDRQVKILKVEPEEEKKHMQSGMPLVKLRITYKEDADTIYERHKLGWTNLFAEDTGHLQWKTVTKQRLGNYLRMLGWACLMAGLLLAVALATFADPIGHEEMITQIYKAVNTEYVFNETSREYVEVITGEDGEAISETVLLEMFNVTRERIELNCANKTIWARSEYNLYQIFCSDMPWLMEKVPFLYTGLSTVIGLVLLFTVPVSDGAEEVHRTQVIAQASMNLLILCAVGLWVAYQLMEEGAENMQLLVQFILVLLLVVMLVLWRFVLSGHSANVDEQLQEFFEHMDVKSAKSPTKGSQRQAVHDEIEQLSAKLEGFAMNLNVRALSLLLGLPLLAPLALVAYVKQKGIREHCTRRCLYNDRILRARAEKVSRRAAGPVKPTGHWRDAIHKVQKINRNMTIKDIVEDSRKATIKCPIPEAWEWRFCVDAWRGIFNTVLLVRMLWIGLIVFLIMGGAFDKLTNFGLSMLNEALASVALGLTTCIFITVGVIMFLLPPVPGVSVYLCGGAVLVKAAEGAWGTAVYSDGAVINASAFANDTIVHVNVPGVGEMDLTLAWFAAVLYTSLVCMFLKLVAASLQQKVIGELMGKTVAIRQMASVNSEMVRAINCIMTQPGLSRAKVFILVGGPDWPTSVVAGILKSNLMWNLLGTLAVYPVILFTVVAGALTVKKSETGSAQVASLASVAMAFSGLSGMGYTLMFVTELKKFVQEERAQVDAVPVDEPVRIKDKEDEKKSEEHEEQRTYDKLDPWKKVLLLVACAFMHVSVLIVLGAGNSWTWTCFHHVEVTTNVSAAPINGNLMGMLVMPVGHIAVGLHLAALIMLFVFNKATKMKTKGWVRVESASTDGPDAPPAPAKGDSEAVAFAPARR